MKNTKRSFIASVLSLILCFAMLIGTTYAWFTDSVTSGKNKIIAGNLDIELYHNATGEATASAGKVVESTTDLFKVDLWEPGVMVYENFLVKNEGTLALKYNLLLDAWDYNTLTKAGTTEAHDLREVIKVAFVDGNFLPTGTDAEKRAAAQAETFSDSFVNVEQNYETLEAGASKKFAVILYWEPTDHDNDYNVNNGQVTSDGDPLFLDVGIRLVATQVDKEKDSFDEKYDEGLTLPGFPAKINTTVSKKYSYSADTPFVMTDDDGNKSTVENGGTSDKLVITVDNANIDTTKDLDSSITNQISRKITTEEGSGEVTYDISFKFIQQTKTGDTTTTQTGNITAFSKIVTNELNIGQKLKNVKVTHSHGGVKTPMTELTSASQDAEGYYYNSNTGWLTIKSKTYSDFIVKYDVPAVKPVKDFEYDPEDKTKLIGLGDFCNEKVIKIPEGVKTIANDVFAFNVSIEEIYLSSTVEDIGYCTKMTQDGGYTYLNSSPFEGCTQLKVIDMSKANMTELKCAPESGIGVLALDETNEISKIIETIILPEKLITVSNVSYSYNKSNVKLYISGNTKNIADSGLVSYKGNDIYWAIDSFEGTNVATAIKPFYTYRTQPNTIHILSTSNYEGTTLTVKKDATNTATIGVAKDYTPAK